MTFGKILENCENFAEILEKLQEKGNRKFGNSAGGEKFHLFGDFHFVTLVDALGHHSHYNNKQNTKTHSFQKYGIC